MIRNRLLATAAVSGVLAVATGVLTALWLCPPASSRASEASALSIESSALDFGEVWESPRLDLALPLRNSSTTPIKIARWANSCNCTAIEPDSFEFQPGELKGITARLDLEAKTTQQGARAFAVGLVCLTADNRRFTWELRGRVKPVLQQQPILHFEPLSDISQPLPPRRLPVAFTAPTSSVRIETDSPHAAATYHPNGEYGQTGVLEVRFAPQIPIGDHNFTLTMRGQFAAPAEEFTKRLTGAISVRPDLRIEPAQVAFPAAVVGSELTDAVTLTSRTGLAARLISVTPNGEGLTAIAEKDSSRIVIRQRSAHDGQVSNVLNIVAMTGDRTYNLTISVNSLWLQPGQ